MPITHTKLIQNFFRQNELNKQTITNFILKQTKGQK